MAQANVARQVRQARQRALNSTAVTSAKSAYTRAGHDYEAAKEAVVAKLKATNPEFRDLLADAQAKRARIATLAKSPGGSTDDSGERQTLEAQLKTVVRRIVAIQDPVINNDSTVKSIVERKGDDHLAAQSAEKEAQNAVSQDPNVLAAQKQLAQAQQQVQQAAARYNSALGAANTAGLYGNGRYPHRRSGYGGYRAYHYSARNYSSHRSFHPVRQMRYVSQKPIHFHTSARRHR